MATVNSESSGSRPGPAGAGWYQELSAWLRSQDVLDQLVAAAERAGRAGVLPGWRVLDILAHVDQVRWLDEHGVLPPGQGVAAPGGPADIDVSYWRRRRAPEREYPDPAEVARWEREALTA